MLRTLTVIAAFQSSAIAHAEPQDLSESLRAIRERHNVPSLVCAAFREGTLIGTGADGSLSTEHPASVSIESKYHIGSCSKAMTAVLMGVVVESTDLTWDTPLGEALPGLSETMHADYARATVQDLLSHRAGIAEDLDPSQLQAAWAITDEMAHRPLREQRTELARRVLESQPPFEPGTRFHYSNYGYIIAASVIEQWADTAYESLAEARLFEPLGMSSAGFGPPGTPGEVDHPLGHTGQDGRTPVALNADDLALDNLALDNPPIFNSAGRVHATITDWGAFVDDFERGLDGGGALLTPETYRFIASDPEQDGYALGWLTIGREWAGDAPALTHAGSNTYWYATTWIAPDRDLAMVVACNAATPGAVAATDDAIGLMIDAFAGPVETPASHDAPSDEGSAAGDGR
ncbi:MAG: serine hydrolase domain-containing protein [Planctomycetota bacterium]